MSFTRVHDANGIDIDNFFYSGRVVPFPRLNYDELLNFNTALSESKVKARVGPALNRDGNIFEIVGQDFVPGIYVPREELDPIQTQGLEKSLRQALVELQRACEL